MTSEEIQTKFNNLKELKKGYEKAIEDNLKVFTYQGVEVPTTYAEYLIEYLELKQKT